MIAVWARQTWEEVRGENTLLPSTAFFPEVLQKRLSEKIHVVTSIGRLCNVLHDWRYLDSHKAHLFKFCEEVLEGLDDLRQEAQDTHEVSEDKMVEDDKQGTQEMHSVKVRIPASKQKTHEEDPIGDRPKKRQRRGQGIGKGSKS
jgi:hypothetical protein